MADGADVESSRLLTDLDSLALPRDLSLRAVAADDGLFLRSKLDWVASITSVRKIRHVFDVTTLLLDRLQCVHEEGGRQQQQQQHGVAHPPAYDGLKCDKFVANLEHMLLCLQQAAFDALVREFLNLIEADIRRWDQYWHQGKHLGDNWFSEWPSGRRPLSTTWPWNIKPSLVILWGVCWQFYGSPVDDGPGSGGEGGWRQPQGGGNPFGEAPLLRCFGVQLAHGDMPSLTSSS